jgi:hypothetical protein
MPFSSQTPPRSQYDRNLTFKLTGGGSDVTFTFPIKPDEFQVQTPARVTTTQTLQGVYQDFGGLGVTTLTYQGNTGWRKRTMNGGIYDGFETFKMLYEQIYTEYHKRLSSNADPTTIKCLVIDDLYDQTYEVSIDDFQGTKSKSNPLLYYYTVRMTVQNTQPNGRAPINLTGIAPDIPSVQYDPETQVPFAMNEVLNGVSIWGPTQIRYYIVQSGDSLESISTDYFGSPSRWKDIADANGIQPPYIFNPGVRLIIPF